MALRKLLLNVEDRHQPRLVANYVEAFRAEELALEWAATLREGLEKLLGRNVAVFLLNYQLGPRDGLELIREAIAAGCGPLIVFLTASHR